jgi:hypothetical protein
MIIIMVELAYLPVIAVSGILVLVACTLLAALVKKGLKTNSSG